MTPYPVQPRSFSNSPTHTRVRESYRNSRLYPVQRILQPLADPRFRPLRAVALVLRVRVDGGPARVACCNGRSSQRGGAVLSLVTLAGLGLDRVAVAGLMEGRRVGLAWAPRSCELQARARRAASRVLALLAGGPCSRALDARRRPAPERARAVSPSAPAPTGAQAKRAAADAARERRP